MHTVARRCLLPAVVLVASATLAGAASVTDLVARVPAGSEMVLAMNASSLRGHPLVQTWLSRHEREWTGLETESTEFLRDSGLDPLKDIDAFVLAVVARDQDPRWLVLVSGRFDPASLEAALIKRGAEPATLADQSVLRLHDHPHRGQALVKLGPEVLIAGDETTLAAALATSPTGSALVRQEVAAGHLDLGADFWVVLDVPEAVRRHVAEAAAEHPTSDSQLRNVVVTSASVRRVTGEAFLSDSLHLRGRAMADGVENAGLLRDALKGAVAAMRLGTQSEHPELVDVLRGVDIRTDGNDVTADASIPLAVIERITSECPRVGQQR